MSVSIWISDTTLFVVMAIFGIIVAINVGLFFRYYSRVRNYLRENYPDKFKELGGLPFYAPMRYASFGTLFSLLYGSENFNDPDFALMKRKMKFHGLLMGLIGVIIFLFFMLIIISRFPQ